MNKRSLVLLGMALVLVGSVNAGKTSRTSKPPVSLDLRSGTVGAIGRTENLTQVIRLMGEENVKAFSYEEEGDTYQAYDVKFGNGEIAKLYLSHFQITSPDFRTKEGLGVGSTWAEFKKAYSDGELDWQHDAYAVWSEK